MVAKIRGDNVPLAYIEGLWVLNAYANVEEMTRNGNVKTVPGPVVLEIKNPTERVLFNPVRDANPFFHVMEFVWMMAGSNDAEWISQFNKRMMEYADDGILRGAYGYRWSQGDQITSAIRLLRESPDTRQCVLQMWDKAYDGPRARSSDRPCNTHIYLRISALGLEMTVCNRSNDFFWGMLGSNVVHFTMLQELIALAVGVPVGPYRVFTNNLHVYTDMPGFNDKWTYKVSHNWYKYDEVSPQPLLREDERFEDFMADAYQMVDEGLDFDGWNTEWFRDVASPMHDAYLEKWNRKHHIQRIGAPDWNLACSEWNTRRKS
jgi:thymidylate synthase